MGQRVQQMSLVGGDYDDSDDDDQDPPPQRVPDVKTLPEPAGSVEGASSEGSAPASALPSVAQLFGDPTLAVAPVGGGTRTVPSDAAKQGPTKELQRLLPPQVRSGRKNCVTDDVTKWNTQQTNKRQKKSLREDTPNTN